MSVFPPRQTSLRLCEVSALVLILRLAAYLRLANVTENPAGLQTKAPR